MRSAQGFVAAVLALGGLGVALIAIPLAHVLMRRAYRWRLSALMRRRGSASNTKPPWPAWQNSETTGLGPESARQVLLRGRSRQRGRIAWWLGLTIVEGFIIGIAIIPSAFAREAVSAWPVPLRIVAGSWPAGLFVLVQWFSTRATLAVSGTWLFSLTCGWLIGGAIATLGFALAPDANGDAWLYWLGSLVALAAAYGLTRLLLAIVDWVRARGAMSAAELLFMVISSAWIGLLCTVPGTPLVAAGLLVTVHLFGWLLGPRAIARLWPLPPAHVLLVLRPFSSPRRREMLLRRVAHLFLEFGPVVTIAGPDVAAASFDLPALRALLSGNLARLFFDGSRWPENPRNAKPLRDLRYSFRQVRCFQDTWWSAFTTYALVADAILLDVRGLASTGVARELASLIESGLIRKTVLFTEDSVTTTYEHLQQVLRTPLSPALKAQIHTQPAKRGVELLVERLLCG